MSGGEAVYLYRWYDGDGVLLYIGITNKPSIRRGAHRSTSWWCLKSYTCIVDAAPIAYDRHAAKACEDEAIASEEPVFNRYGLDPTYCIDRINSYLRSHGGPQGCTRDGSVPSDLIRILYRGIPEPEITNHWARVAFGYA